MAALCIRCHQTVLAQLTTSSGVHGHMANLSRCAVCHPDHRGRDLDPTGFALARFDHTTAGFPLLGKHAQAQCDDCHGGNRYMPSPRACTDCHTEPAQHAGMFGTDCSACHTSDAWRPALIKGATFDHTQTAFTLTRHTQDFAGQPMQCTACHKGQAAAFDPYTCVSCHNLHDASFVSQHTLQDGTDCTQCHDGADRMEGFDHASFFPLDGSHAGLECASCHADQRFRGTPINCAGCHQEPAIHAGFFGQRCGACHTPTAWRPALLTAHTFPLDHGGQGPVTCLTCHTRKYPEYTCYACHAHQQTEILASHTRVGISVAEVPNCAGCHLSGTVEKKK